MPVQTCCDFNTNINMLWTSLLLMAVLIFPGSESVNVLPSTSGKVESVVGDVAHLTCRIQNLDLNAVVWKREGVTNPLTINNVVFTSDPRIAVDVYRHDEITTSTLRIHDVTAGDAGNYRCFVSNNLGETTVKLVVEDPPFKRDSKAPRLRLRHGPDRQLILQRDLEEVQDEEKELSVRKRCNCYCHSKVYHNNWDCCPCPWTEEICFPGDAMVTLEDGSRLEMKDLMAGHKIQTVKNREIAVTDVKTFFKRRPSSSAIYLAISTQDGYTITLSGRHLVFASRDNNTLNMEPRFALAVKPGDYLFSPEGCEYGVCPSLVTEVNPVVKQGVYVPLTDEGTLLVDGVYASCYSSINHHVAHAFTTPFRWFPWLLSPWQEDGYSPIISWLKEFGHVILPKSHQFDEEANSVLPKVRIEL